MVRPGLHQGAPARGPELPDLQEPHPLHRQGRGGGAVASRARAGRRSPGAPPDRRPVLALTVGDPAGIGPEIVLSAASEARVLEACRLVVLGPATVLRATARRGRLPFSFTVSDSLPSGGSPWKRPRLVDPGGSGPPPSPGRATAAGGRMAARAVQAAVDLCLEGLADAMVTAPLSKEGLRLAGLEDPGHTEMLQRLTGARQVGMLFWSRRLRVALLTTHLGLREALAKVRRARILRALHFLDGEHRRWFGRAPRIAVAGLNPHAGEAGRFGRREEEREIRPAVEGAAASGLRVEGPFSPDTVFIRAARGEFDLVLALYHDQGTIAVKSLTFGRAVNVTLGLPFLRTSVDHGTAYDIAGTGRADAGSLVEALLLAARVCRKGRRGSP